MIPDTPVVLIVDDEELVRNVARDILTHYGYATLLAEGTETAAALMESHGAGISLVLLDAGVPRFAIDPRVPLIVSSGMPAAQALRDFDPEHVVGYLSKPYTAARLRDAVGLALQSRRLAA